MTVKARSDIRRKLRILKHAQMTGNISKTCRYFGISREIFYQWKRAYEASGETALINSKPCPQNPKIRVSKPIEEKILYIRKNYHFGALRISWYLERYHGIKVSSGGVQGVLKRNGLNRLPEFARKRSKIANFQRYEKRVPGHHIQMDVKFLKFITEDNRKVKRFQYTAIDDATRIRVLKIYKKHTQKNAIDFVDHIIEKLPFRIHTIRTDNGHEFQAKFHWHVADLGINHVYIKPRTPRLNGKVERSHRADEQEFYQLLHYTDDVDLNKKLKIWEDFYNLHRPHGAFKGKTPYEVLKEKISDGQNPISVV
jgi:transposase InsO family protein